MTASYYEFVIKGDEEVVCAYLEGYFRGKGIKEGYFFSKDKPLHFHHLREMIRYHGEVAHVICHSKLRPAIHSAIKQGGKQFGFEVKETRKISKASFRFKFETANRQVAGTIKRALNNRSAGVDLVDYEPQEEVDPGAKGPEGYAPLHTYTFRGEGTVEGDVAGVLKTHEKLCANEFICCDDIEIHA